MFEFEKPQGFHVYATSAALKFEQGHYKDQPVRLTGRTGLH
ncbi:hypothetical protein HMPREF1487_09571 [Pseudomonas sp. HPB0071]|nr:MULTISPECIES: hypothetical protein [unclassified Pseudomonas]ENA26530.1 hypothetical protein HMPREF1487_09571 [Pseudomonas sp. HPB0071]